MRQFIDQDQGGMAGQGGIEVKFVEGATIGHGTTWQHVEPPAGRRSRPGRGYRPSATTSMPSARRSWAVSSMAYVLPTPAVAPKKILSFRGSAGPLPPGHG